MPKGPRAIRTERQNRVDRTHVVLGRRTDRSGFVRVIGVPDGHGAVHMGQCDVYVRVVTHVVTDVGVARALGHMGPDDPCGSMDVEGVTHPGPIDTPEVHKRACNAQNQESESAVVHARFCVPSRKKNLIREH